MVNIEYDDRKCSCCERVYVNCLLMDLKDQDSNFIICLSCANKIHAYIDEIKKAQTK